MGLNEAIFQQLTTMSAITALVDQRVYPKLAPQGTMTTYIVFHRITTPREASMDGPSGLASPLIQFNCYGPTMAGARQVADAVRLTLDGFKGSMGTEQITVCGAWVEDDRDDYDDELQLYVTQLDVTIQHNE